MGNKKSAKVVEEVHSLYTTGRQEEEEAAWQATRLLHTHKHKQAHTHHMGYGRTRRRRRWEKTGRQAGSLAERRAGEGENNGDNPWTEFGGCFPRK